MSTFVFCVYQCLHVWPLYFVLVYACVYVYLCILYLLVYAYVYVYLCILYASMYVWVCRSLSFVSMYFIYLPITLFFPLSARVCLPMCASSVLLYFKRKTPYVFDCLHWLVCLSITVREWEIHTVCTYVCSCKIFVPTCML